LLTAQLGLTVILLAGAGIFLKSFVALTHVPLGFDAASGWSMRVAPSGPQYATDDQVRAYAAALTAQAQAIPGVRDVAVATSSPLLSGPLVIATKSGTMDPAAPDSGTRAIWRAVSAGYFDTIGTRIIRGRGILPSDVAGAPAVAVVNEQFTRAAFGGGDPIGAYIDFTARHAAAVRGGTVLIVGVAADIKEVGLNETKISDVYVPFAQQPTRSFELIVRGSGGRDSMAKNLRAAAVSADPSVPVTGLSTLDARVGQALSRERFNLILVAGFAIVAVLVGAIGIYGAMAYAATARWREFGVRLALGASPYALLGTALWQAARLGLIGGALGVAGAIGLGFWIGNALYLVPGEHNGLLYNVTTTDPLALVGALGGIVLVALLAGALPARRVARIDPVRALRAD
jgi:predicted permease